MRFTILTVLATTTALVTANPLHALQTTTTTSIPSLVLRAAAVPANNSTNYTKPLNYGAVIFDGVDMIDIWGPLDILQLNSLSYKMNLHLIAATRDPITTGSIDPSDPARNKHGSSFWPAITPTATFADDLDLDVLIVPGGPGVRAAEGLQPIINYVRETYPGLQYLITICTGASLAARAGVLDGRRATTNKRAWAQMTAFGPDVKWVAPARYVVDGNIWSSSGVSRPTPF